MAYDVLIIGAGPAGLTAGIYSARAGLKTCIISKWIGGMANSILLIENWPGYRGAGAELVDKFYRQAKELGVDFIVEEALKIKKDKAGFIVETKKEEIEGKSLIIATGKERKKLGIQGEEELTGKGVSYCSTCDAFFFKGKTVAVIAESGCGEISVSELSNLAKKIYILYKGKEFGRENKPKNAEVFYEAIAKKIEGKDKVEGIVFEEKGKEKKIKVDGIFIELGCISLGEFIKNLKVKTDKEGFIEVDGEMRTSVKGIFAAGDATNSKVKQVLTASSQGAIASKSASEFLKKNS